MIKKDNGITLVALVITIIVMLILAGVTISIVINANIFNQAETATIETQKNNFDDAIALSIADGYSFYYGEKTATYDPPIGQVATTTSITYFVRERLSERLGASAVGTATTNEVGKCVFPVTVGSNTTIITIEKVNNSISITRN